MSRSLRALLSLVILASAVVLAASAPAVGDPAAAIDDIEEDCLQIPPEEVAPVALSTQEIIPLKGRILTQAADRALAKSYLEVTRDTFARIGISVKLRYTTVVPPDEWDDDPDLSGGPNQADILSFMKELFGGERPPGDDFVYFMTRHWDGGFADCIGGIRFPNRAFAFGSIDYATEGLVPSPTVNEGVIAAHEIGHLLGAHHHYSNCAEAQPWGALRGDPNPCTTMWPAAATMSSTFGTVERSFIRDYAQRYGQS